MPIRFAVPSDCAALLRIYGQYIDTPITFEYTLPTEAEFTARIQGILDFYPYLIWEEDGQVLGYAYAHRIGERAAYQWGAELSVYLDRSRTGRGLGRRLYTALMNLLRLQGVRTVYGIVTLPNENSEALHCQMGFQLQGVDRSAGYKNGAWRDVARFQRSIAAYDPAPEPPKPFSSVPREAAEAVLRQAEAD